MVSISAHHLVFLVQFFSTVALLGKAEEASDEVNDKSNNSLQLILRLALCVILILGGLGVGLIVRIGIRLGAEFLIGLLVGSCFLGKLIALGLGTILTGLGRFGSSLCPVVTRSFGYKIGVGITTVTGVGSVASLGTGGLNNFHLVGVTVCQNLFLSKDGFTTHGASLTIGKTVFGTGRILTFKSLFGMSERFRLVSYVAVATVTGIGGEARISTSGSCYNCVVAMSERRNRSLSYEDFATDRALFTFAQACHSASGSYGRNELCIVLGAKILFTSIANVVLGFNVGMSERSDNICYVIVETSRAGVSSITTFGTSRRCYSCVVVMSERCYFVCNVAVATYGASVGGVATVRAIGSCYN